MTTILINDHAFHEDSALPARGRAYMGTWVPNEGGVLLLSASRKPIAQLVNNGRDAPFFVTAGRTPVGKLYYMQGLSSCDADWLGLPESNAMRSAIAKQLLEDVSSVPAIALVTRELQIYPGGGSSYNITASTQWLSLGVCGDAPTEIMVAAIRQRLAIAGLHAKGLRANPLSAGGGMLAELKISPSQRITLDFDASSHPSARFHGAPGNWPLSQLDLSARAQDWRADPLPTDAEPPAAAPAGFSF